MPLNWPAVVGEFSPVQKLVHLAARYDSVDEERLRTELLSIRRKAYNDELGIQAGKVGCAGRRGRLGNGAILSALNDASATDAQSIANTYNYYLALEIERARQDNVRGNRHYYAKRYGEWVPTYWNWKDDQIVQMADSTARAMAQQDFYQYNAAVMGTAKLEPRTAVCPVCQGWVARGIVPLRVALNNPGPWHPNCPHSWSTRPDKVSAGDCKSLWLGA